MFKVFVYGTLKRGQPNHHWLSDIKNGKSTFLGIGFTTKLYPLVIATRYNIPFLLDKEGIGHNVKGEVFEVDQSMMNKLDVLEDYPNFYDREIQNIRMDEEITPCWTYIIRKFPESLLKNHHLETYENSEQQPYCERLKRNPEISARDLLYSPLQ